MPACTLKEISNLWGINSSLFFQNIDSRVKGTQGLRQVDTPLSHWGPKTGALANCVTAAGYKQECWSKPHEWNCDWRWNMGIFFEPDIKEKIKMWVGENDERTQVARRARTSKRIVCILFWLPWNGGSNWYTRRQECYWNILPRFGSFCCSKSLYCSPSLYRRTQNQDPSW